MNFTGTLQKIRFCRVKVRVRGNSERGLQRVRYGFYEAPGFGVQDKTVTCPERLF